MKEILIFNLLYKWKYLIAILKSKFVKKNQKKTLETVTYVAREVDKDWIFGAKVRRLAKFSSLNAKTYYHNKLRDLPDSDGYFFVFHQYFYRAIRHNPKILNKKNIVMFTHANWTVSFSKTHVIWCLKKADKVICLNSVIQKELIDAGLNEEKTEVLHIASDSTFFYPHERKSGSVGFCSAFSDRKNPDLIFSIIKNMPERTFYLIGKNWENYKNYDELIALENFTYFNNQPYEKYPDLYNKIDVFISPSKNEGGPVPLLEAMLSNCFPISTKTGFGPDIIEHGKNGFLINDTDHYSKVIDLINKANKSNINVRETVLAYSWQNCSKKLDELFLEKQP
ncbi:glycosyltransferase family 4 protein [uncultured Polaribacter sp.]|uniref:glycosyltransferase family 4 protein n=1 Tax=uncultured Polaribacter sp. TaxID=174711 RepID=UPI00262B1E80|nr:glycosyltransferase family 4 protein [uncultured Polaribacter sp.]